MFTVSVKSSNTHLVVIKLVLDTGAVINSGILRWYSSSAIGRSRRCRQQALLHGHSSPLHCF